MRSSGSMKFEVGRDKDLLEVLKNVIVKALE